MRVGRGGQTVVLERSGDAEWKLVEGGQGRGQGGEGGQPALRAPRAEVEGRSRRPTGEDLAQYGLDAPTAEVRSTLKADGASSRSVLVGKRDGDRRRSS